MLATGFIFSDFYKTSALRGNWTEITWDKITENQQKTSPNPLGRLQQTQKTCGMLPGRRPECQNSHNPVAPAFSFSRKSIKTVFSPLWGSRLCWPKPHMVTAQLQPWWPWQRDRPSLSWGEQRCWRSEAVAIVVNRVKWISTVESFDQLNKTSFIVAPAFLSLTNSLDTEQQMANGRGLSLIHELDSDALCYHH